MRGVEKTLTWQNSKISYHVFGQGNKTFIALHGYGQDGRCFESLANSSKETYRWICIDLPFHGNTTWNENKPCSNADWNGILALLIREEGISGNYSIVAFSIGGHYALAMNQKSLLNIDRMVFINADGLTKNKFQKFMVANPIGLVLMKIFILNARPIQLLISILSKTGIYSKEKSKLFQMTTKFKGQRKLLFERWNVIKRLSANKVEVLNNLNEKPTEVVAIYGAKDKVVKPKFSIQFVSELKNGKCIRIDTGHKMLENNDLCCFFNELD